MAISLSPTTWRLIPPLEAAGAVQMAVDRWIFEQHWRGELPPTLRFYTWAPAAISLGHHQRQYPDFWRSLTWQGQPVDLVRRPTGGRAVLHQGDLSYLVVTSHEMTSRARTYAAICEFLIQGWRTLGVELQYGRAGRGYIGHPSCFSTATAADLVTERGDKVIGSAQLRRDRTILQHGSVILSSPSELFQHVFGEAPGPPILSGKSEIPVAAIIEALTAAASRCFAIELALEPLSQSEWQQIFALQQSPL